MVEAKFPLHALVFLLARPPLIFALAVRVHCREWRPRMWEPTKPFATKQRKPSYRTSVNRRKVAGLASGTDAK